MAVKTGNVVLAAIIGICVGALSSQIVLHYRMPPPKAESSGYVVWRMVEPGTFVQHDKESGIVCLGTGSDLADMLAKQTYRCEFTK